MKRTMPFGLLVILLNQMVSSSNLGHSACCDVADIKKMSTRVRSSASRMVVIMFSPSSIEISSKKNSIPSSFNHFANSRATDLSTPLWQIKASIGALVGLSASS